jgi:hypothetical protein
MIALYLLGWSMLPGYWGGCALVYPGNLPFLQCTYGAVAECTRATLKTCAVPVYSRDLSTSADPVAAAVALVAVIRENDPTYLGAPTHTATAREITKLFLSGKDSRK